MIDPEIAEGPAAVDPRLRQVLERYASLVGALPLELGPGLVEVELPIGERALWEGETKLRLALSPEALDDDPEAELLGIGSPAFHRLLAAIRTRGFVELRGRIACTAHDEGTPPPPVPVVNAVAGECATETRFIPFGRMLARVAISAGPQVEERLVESPLVNLVTGVQAPMEVTDAIVASQAEQAPSPHVPLLQRRSPDELVPLLFDELERELSGELVRVATDAANLCSSEVARLERYYTAMADEIEPESDPDAAGIGKAAVLAELARRKEEETLRYRVRVSVHPLQLVEWHVPSERATWQLTAADGRSGELAATRILVSGAQWEVVCPGCGSAPTGLAVCTGDHVACASCSSRCGVCGSVACRSHGLTTCKTEGHPVCQGHARTCKSCGARHCSAHATVCDTGAHEICNGCAVSCGRCGVALCRSHAVETGEDAPRGRRHLCQGCTVLCEAAGNEPVGLDEVVRCASCERHICETHRATCAIDGTSHCSRHLRRSDRSGRLVCETHRATCADEPHSLLASDEVMPCATCGRVACALHSAVCDADGASHCVSHLRPLADRPERMGCEAHRNICHVDGVAFSITGTRECPVCAKHACAGHRGTCRHCARQVCANDLDGGRCATCASLMEVADPPDDLILAAIAANGGEPPKVKKWRMASDASGAVAELELGWTRRLVFSVIRGETRPKTVMEHGLLASKRTR